jgi:hypothetical protein
MRLFGLIICTILVHFAPLSIALELSEASPKAKVSILSPKDGDVVSSPVKIVFGAEHVTILPAGIEHTNSGHHHLLIDVDELPDLTMPIPADANHKHFGKGQTEVTLMLKPGKHTLQLLLGDHLHRPHVEPVVSEKIEITVK